MTLRHLCRMLPMAAVVLATTGSGECAGPFGVDCTTIGCSDGLSVRITGQLPAPATVRVTAGEEARTFQCQTTEHCQAFFDGWTPADVSIQVDWGTGSRTATATPDYEPVYPNGPRCDPVCRQASVQVSVP
jgi:hypothetical protein